MLNGLRTCGYSHVNIGRQGSVGRVGYDIRDSVDAGAEEMNAPLRVLLIGSGGLLSLVLPKQEAKLPGVLDLVFGTVRMRDWT